MSSDGDNEYNDFFSNLMEGVDSSSDDEKEEKPVVTKKEPVKSTVEIQIKPQPKEDIVPKVEQPKPKVERSPSPEEIVSVEAPVRPKQEPVEKPKRQVINFAESQSAPKPVVKSKPVINRGKKHAVMPSSMFGGSSPFASSHQAFASEPVVEKSSPELKNTPVDRTDSEDFETIHIEENKKEEEQKKRKSTHTYVFIPTIAVY